MIIWVDAQLSPALPSWMREQFSVEANALRDLGLRDASDERIFFAAREASAVVMTKDADFVRLFEQHGAPPQIIWITCGNTSNAYLQQVFIKALPAALKLLTSGESLVEISNT